MEPKKVVRDDSLTCFVSPNNEISEQSEHKRKHVHKIPVAPKVRTKLPQFFLKLYRRIFILAAHPFIQAEDIPVENCKSSDKIKVLHSVAKVLKPCTLSYRTYKLHLAVVRFLS